MNRTSNGLFELHQQQGRWLFKGTSRTPFWSMGVCCTGVGSTKGQDDPKNPSYGGYRLFIDDNAWVDDTLAKLKANGFNSIGGWSDTNLFQRHGGKDRLPYFEVLHLGAYNKAPWKDMFTKNNAQIIDKAAKDQIQKLRNDPNLVGYFSDNELGWWREALFVTYLAMGPKEPGKQKLIEFTSKFYGGSYARFARDWTAKGKSFSALDSSAKLKPGGNGMSLVKAWQSFLTDNYYRQMKDAIRRYDPSRLILGDRYCQFYYPNVAQTATKYVDAISTNYGADWNNGQNTEYFLSTLHKITKKPVIITEFYMAAMENRSGNKNSSGGFPVVKTQLDRENAVRTYLKDLGRRPYVVGAHWFQFYDEPTHGRGDGENYNMGLVDIHGEYYQGLLKVFRDFKVGKPWNPTFKSPIPTAPNLVEKDLKAWDKVAALVKTGPQPAFGDMYLCADKDNLWVGLASMSFTDESLYPNKKIPEADRSRFEVKVNGKSYWVRFSGNKRTCTLSPGLKLGYWRDGVRSELILKIPRPASRRISIQASLSTHGRADRMTWSDNRILSPAK
ncbi:MAG: hypothetical protein H7Y17_13245 [Chlorobia bacterium]|nr:hypothetical protein [Fimbriimonadaceae bacterium]